MGAEKTIPKDALCFLNSEKMNIIPYFQGPCKWDGIIQFDYTHYMTFQTKLQKAGRDGSRVC